MFNAVRYVAQTGGHRRLLPCDLPPCRVVYERMQHWIQAGYDGGQRRKDSKAHIAVVTMGHLLALTVTPANHAGREQIASLAEKVQGGDWWHCWSRRTSTRATPNAAEVAQQHGLRL